MCKLNRYYSSIFSESVNDSPVTGNNYLDNECRQKVNNSHILVDQHQTPRPRAYSVRNKQDVGKQRSLRNFSGASKYTTRGISEGSDEDREQQDSPANDRKRKLSKKKKRRSNQPSSVPDKEACLTDSDEYTQRGQTRGSDEDSHEQGKRRSHKRSLKKKRSHSRANESTATQPNSDKQSGHSSKEDDDHFQPGKAENNVLRPIYRIQVHSDFNDGFVPGSERNFPKSAPVSAASRSHSEDELLDDEPVKTKHQISSELLSSSFKMFKSQVYKSNPASQESRLSANTGITVDSTNLSSQVESKLSTPQPTDEANEQEQNEPRGTLSTTFTVEDLSGKENHYELQDGSRSSTSNSAISEGQDELKTNSQSRASHLANTEGEHKSQSPHPTSSAVSEPQDPDRHQTKSKPISVYSANTAGKYESQGSFQSTASNLLKGAEQISAQLDSFEETITKPTLFSSTKIPQGMPPPATINSNIGQDYLQTPPRPILSTDLLTFPSHLPGPVDIYELVQLMGKDD